MGRRRTGCRVAGCGLTERGMVLVGHHSHAGHRVAARHRLSQVVHRQHAEGDSEDDTEQRES